MIARRYTLADFQRISETAFEFPIPDATIVMFNYLLQNSNSSLSLERGTIFHSRSLRNNHTSTADANPIYKTKRKYRSTSQMASTEPVIPFKTTTIERKTGIESEINKIRSLINKCTDKTYTSIKDQLFMIMENIVLLDEEQAHFPSIGQMIFDICSSNKFYSKIYAQLYDELVARYDWLLPAFQSQYDNYVKEMNAISYADPNTDYDNFCNNNKRNERRRAKTMFYLSLVKRHCTFISAASFYEKLQQMFQLVFLWIQEENKVNEVDELVENIALCIDRSFLEEVEDNIEPELHIQNKIDQLAKCKIREYPSLSSKTIFKFKDLCE